MTILALPNILKLTVRPSPILAAEAQAIAAPEVAAAQSLDPVVHQEVQAADLAPAKAPANLAVARNHLTRTVQTAVATVIMKRMLR